MKITALLSALAAAALAAVPASTTVEPRAATTYPDNVFDQIIDHFPNSSRYAPHPQGTFKQHYYFDSQFYKPGGPVFLYIGGEVPGTSRFSNLETGIIRILMERFNGLGVILENRYYGESYPVNSSTTDQLAYLTTEQTIADNAYFAQHVKFPGVNASLNAPNTPWIMYGGSLAGAQTAFTVKTYGDIIYGGICASGVVHAVHAYPQWYNPIQKFAPQDCVSRINHIVDNFDHLRAANDTDAIHAFKAQFGLEAVQDDRDFAMTVAFPLGGPMNYPTNTWQELNWDPSQGSPDFFNFCSNVTNDDAPKEILQVDQDFAKYTHGQPWTGLGNYANYIKKYLNPVVCPSGDYDNTSCYGTQNQSYWADSANSDMRSYLYSTCTEQGAYQVAPATGPSLISRVLQVNYTQQWCTWAFPKGRYNAIPPQPDLSRYNQYGDLKISADRLALIDGSSDVWLDVTYHAEGTPVRTSSDLHPEYLINGGGHHWDSYGILDVDAEPQFIREAHKWEIRVVDRWLRGFASWRKGGHY